MTILRALFPLAAVVALSSASTGCYVRGHGHFVRYGHGPAVVGVHAPRAVTYAAPPRAYAPRPHYGYGYVPAPAPVVVVAAPAPAGPVPVAAPVPPTPAGAAVDYKDCGRGGPGSVHITFASSGRATDVRVVAAAGAIDEATTRCLRDRFSAVTIPAFVGPAQTFSWPVELSPVPAAAAAPPAAAIPPLPSAPPVETEDRHEAPPADGHAGSGGWM